MFPFAEVGRHFLPFLIWSAFLPWEHLTRFKAGTALQLFRLRCESRNLQRHQQSTALCSGLHPRMILHPTTCVSSTIAGQAMSGPPLGFVNILGN